MFKMKNFYVLLCATICGVIFSPTMIVNAKEICYQTDIYHQHTGSSAGGGCYTIAHSGTREIEIPCGGTMHYWPDLDITQCTNCGASYFGDQSHRECWHSSTKTENYNYYTTGCRMSEETLLAKLYLEQSTVEWTKSLGLKASFELAADINIPENAYIWNQGEATRKDTFEVKENGSYSLELNAGENANTRAALITVDIKNIDHTPAKIFDYELNPETGWTQDGVELCLGEVTDLQPSGEKGSGLHEKPFSFDGGKSWTDEKTYFFKENGSHRVYVRDQLENSSFITVEIDHIDHSGPTIEEIYYDDTKNIKETVLTVKANDLQEDGKEGCGLHEMAYSFDGGKHWTNNNSIEIRKNGVISLVIRDRLNNQTQKEIEIRNLDCSAPQIFYTMDPESWTNRDVVVSVSAKDLQEDGSEGIGLAEKWLSVDGGETFTDHAELIVESNGSLQLIARDCYDQRSKVEIIISQIDKDLPWVDISLEKIKNGEENTVLLRGRAGDDLSGLAEEAFSWNKGYSYGTESCLEVKENGLYQLTVRDKAGNWRYKQIMVDSFNKEDKKLVSKDIAVKKEKKVPKSVSENGIEKQEKERKEESYIKAAEEIQTEIVKESIWPKICMLIGFISLFVLFLFFVFYFLYHLVFIYGRNQEKYKLIGLTVLKKEENLFVVKITDSCIADCMENEMMLKTTGFFVLRHKDEILNILLPDEQSILKNIEKEIYFDLIQ